MKKNMAAYSETDLQEMLALASLLRFQLCQHVQSPNQVIRVHLHKQAIILYHHMHTLSAPSM